MKKARSRQYLTETITKAYYADDLALLANTLAQAKKLYSSLHRYMWKWEQTLTPPLTGAQILVLILTEVIDRQTKKLTEKKSSGSLYWEISLFSSSELVFVCSVKSDCWFRGRCVLSAFSEGSLYYFKKEVRRNYLSKVNNVGQFKSHSPEFNLNANNCLFHLVGRGNLMKWQYLKATNTTQQWIICEAVSFFLVR